MVSASRLRPSPKTRSFHPRPPGVRRVDLDVADDALDPVHQVAALLAGVPARPPDGRHLHHDAAHREHKGARRGQVHVQEARAQQRERVGAARVLGPPRHQRDPVGAQAAGRRAAARSDDAHVGAGGAQAVRAGQLRAARGLQARAAQGDGAAAAGAHREGAAPHISPHLHLATSRHISPPSRHISHGLRRRAPRRSSTSSSARRWPTSRTAASPPRTRRRSSTSPPSPSSRTCARG